MALHPVHLIPDREGNLPPSALVPFCSFQGELLGQENPDLDNLTMCDLFKATILEGQLCYSLEIEKLKGKPTKSGKNNGLFLLVDPKFTPKAISTDRYIKGIQAKDQLFKIFIHTLSQNTQFGPGSYRMSALKKMTGTESFKELSDHQKKCRVHNIEECQTQLYLQHVMRECNCLPWAMQVGRGEGKQQVKSADNA